MPDLLRYFGQQTSTHAQPPVLDNVVSQIPSTRKPPSPSISVGDSERVCETDAAQEGEREMVREDEAHVAEPKASAKMVKSAWPIQSSGREGPERKRRKLEHGDGMNGTSREQAVTSATHEEQLPSAAQSRIHAAEETSTPAALLSDHGLASGGSEALESRPNGTPPKKMLRLSGSGKLGSPSSKSETAKDGRPKRRGRPRKTLVVICKYAVPGSDAANTLGVRLDGILAGKERYHGSSGRSRFTAAEKEAAKVTHPFFIGKVTKARSSSHDQETSARRQALSSASPDRRSFAATPGKIRRQVLEMKAARGLIPSEIRPDPQPQIRPTIWPAPGLLHVRGDMFQVTEPATHSCEFRPRKRKAASAIIHTTPVSLGSIDVHRLLREESGPRLRPDGFSDPDSSLHLPTRHVMSGPEILSRVTNRICEASSKHPAVSAILTSIPKHLTAYDHGRGEPLPWTSKYQPTSVDCMLQTGSEGRLLREWIRNLAVVSTSGAVPTINKAAKEKQRRKRKKRGDELDNFITSSGDEADLGALSELDEPLSQGSRAGNRSLVRDALTASSDARRTSNVIVISGPAGSGKTAMVYAAAKELSSQVFEINSGSRRSGRDILERIGDVLGNHIVNQDRNVDSGNTSSDELSAKASAEIQKDIESGRQGTMNSFFKPQVVSTKTKPALKKAANRIIEQISKPARKTQKQSVILLEEVDILFEEDKSFWSTILGLLLTSRRPFVLTCTDEFVLPIDDLAPHAILRVTPPPPDLVADYLLAIAAKEGHLLERDEVLALYRHKGQDLRATITELQFWCQMGIGDPRSGLSWILQRWPPGVGVDISGNPQRVISEGTYRSSMSFKSQSSRQSDESITRQQLLIETWQDHGMDPRDDAHRRMAKFCLASQECTGDQRAALRSLSSMQRYSEHLSALDGCCLHGLPIHIAEDSCFDPLGTSLQSVRFDTSLPELTAKARASYTETPRLLECHEAVDYEQMALDHITTTCSLLDLAFVRPTPSDMQIGVAAGPTSRTESAPMERTPIPANDMYAAFEELLEPMYSSQSLSAPPPGYSALYSPLSSIMTDIAPYVRDIARHDELVAAQTRQLHEAMHGNTEGKMRKTRAARGALEGKGRGGVRRERWWDVQLDEKAIAATAGPLMMEAGAKAKQDLLEQVQLATSDGMDQNE